MNSSVLQCLAPLFYVKAPPKKRIIKVASQCLKWTDKTFKGIISPLHFIKLCFSTCGE